MQSSIETINHIESVILENSILKHPFYQAWQRGELTKEALQDYAAQYYHHVEAFPTYLSALHSHTKDMITRQAILENLIDEERGAENHPELWIQFAEAVGATRENVLNSTIQPETQNLISEFKDICINGTVSEGLSALYSYESQIPEVSATKIDGLTKFYGVTSESGLKYFKVHQEADVKHSAD
jgi:pyrroloquinoline-quinone synthase